jgi:signal transduction histidine kinase
MEMEERFEAEVLELLPDAVVWVKPVWNETGAITDFTFVYANKRGNELIGHPKGALQGLSVLRDCVGGTKSCRENFENFLQVYQTGQAQEFCFTSEYSGLTIETQRRPFKGGVLSHTRDRDEVRQAEEKVAESQRQLQSIIDNSPIGIVVYRAVRDESGTITDFQIISYNDRSNQMMGYTNKDREQYGFRKLLQELSEGADQYFPWYVDVVEKGVSMDREQYVQRTGRWLALSVRKLDDGFQGMLTDITDLKCAQFQLEKYVEELKRSNRNLEEFAYAASHDLKEPVRKIHFFSERIKASLGNRLLPEEERYFERMQMASQRMSSLIDDLLAYSEVSHRVHRTDPVDMNQLINQVLSDLDLEMEQRGATVTVDHLFTVYGHQRQLQQAFQNLISNALKYSKPDVPPRIHITCRKVQGKDIGLPLTAEEQQHVYYCLAVSDNGIGFDQADAERIFNVFTRLHGMAEYRGTGIGLSIVRKVILNHGGHIKAESEPGKGSTFYVYLPES